MRPASPSGSVSRKMSFSSIMRTTIFGHSSRICFKSSFSTHSVRFPPLPRNSILSTFPASLNEYWMGAGIAEWLERQTRD